MKTLLRRFVDIQGTTVTKKEALTPPSLIGMFEDILQQHGLFQDSSDWHECEVACHVDWLKPLIADGRIVETGSHLAWPDGVPENCKRPQFRYHEFDVTATGMDWWLHHYAENVAPESYVRLIEPYGEYEAQLTGRGIGAELTYRFFYREAQIAMRGILDGYFEFVSFYHYYRDFSGASITVRLTAEGMKFFDSLPRLVLECA